MNRYQMLTCFSIKSSKGSFVFFVIVDSKNCETILILKYMETSFMYFKFNDL